MFCGFTVLTRNLTHFTNSHFYFSLYFQTGTILFLSKGFSMFSTQAIYFCFYTPKICKAKQTKTSFCKFIIYILTFWLKNVIKNKKPVHKKGGRGLVTDSASSDLSNSLGLLTSD